METRNTTPESYELHHMFRQMLDAGCSHVTAFDSTKDALKHVLSEKKEGDHLYMVGSLYLIGEILEDLKLQLHRM